MFIHGFEGSWWRHPFWRRRFLLARQEDLEKLQQSSVESVIVDISKGRPAEPLTPCATAAIPVTERRERREQINKVRRPYADRGSPPPRYEHDRAEATRLVKQALRLMKGVFQEVRLGKAIREAEVGALVDDISRQLDRDAHMLMRVVQLKARHEYTYLHSVAVCTLMVNLGRHLQLPPEQIRELGLAGLLHDVGKMAVPEAVLDKPTQLSDAEIMLIREHPARGAAILQAGAIPDLAIEVCLHHHEKFDGTGYPDRQSGEAISLAARMGAICDVYDALTSHRAYKDAWTPVQAVTQMWSWVGHFDRNLLFRFMQSIGVFPEGMLVRLRSNRLAVVLANGRRASRPRVLAFYSIIHSAMIPHCIVTITDSLSGDQIIGVEDPQHWSVAIPDPR